MVKKRRRHTAAYKFRVALEAVEGSRTISQLSSEHEIHPNLIRAYGNCWKTGLGSSLRTASANKRSRRHRKQNFMNRSGGSRWNLSG